MNLNEINQELTELSTCGDPTFEQAAVYIQALISQIQNAILREDEATELLSDVQRQLEIMQDSQKLKFKETLNTIISGLLVILTIGITKG